MPTPLFNPDHSTSVLLENGQNPAIRESYTIAQILSFAATLGCDSVIIRPDFVNYDQTPCYYAIYAFNLGTLSEYYVASGDWYDTNPETQSDILVQSITGSTGYYEQCKVITLRNDGLGQSNTVQFNTISTLKTKDGINYLDFNWSIYGRQVDPYIFATNASIGTLYVNGTPLVDYIWESAPVISGKEGSLRLPQLKNVPNLNPVTDAELSAFDVLPDAANLRTLYSNIVYGEERVVAWSGEDANMTITWTDATHFTMKMYTQNLDVPFYTVSYTLSHASDIPYVAFLLSVEEGVEDPTWYGRPSFVFYNNTNGKYEYNLESTSDVYYEQIGLWLKRTYSYPSNDLWGQANEEEGGDGYNDLQDDPILNPNTPTVGAVATGFTRLYRITGEHKDKLSNLMNWFNDPDLQFENKLFVGDPMQALIGVNICPLPINAVGAPNMHFLGIDTGIASDGVITDQFQEIDCGSINMDMWMNDTYLDFAPYTKIKAVLPYVGVIDLSVDDLKYKVDRNGKRIKKPVTLSLKYVVDTLTGACVAHLFVNDSLHYEASGNCYIGIPLTQRDYTSVINSIKQAVAGVAESALKGAGLAAMTGGAGAGAAGVMAATSMVGSAINVMTQHPDIKYVGGNTGATSGYMGFDRPFLLVEEPVLARPSNDQHYIGMPSYITGTVGSFHDTSNSKPQFARFKDVHLENIDCLEQERNEIMEFLTNGVMLDDGSAAPNVTPTVTGDRVIVLLHNKSERNVIGKTFESGTGNRLKIEGKTFFNQSVLNPVFIIPATEVYTYNYAYVPLLHRYYYITDIVALENNMLEIHMQVDPLQSFKEEIKACKGICMRSEWRNNFLINDGAMMVKQPQKVATLQFIKEGVRFNFARNDASFIVIVASGTTL